MIWEAFNLSIKGDGWGGVSADYAVVADYADKYALDRIDCWRVIKAMCGAYSRSSAKKRGKR